MSFVVHAFLLLVCIIESVPMHIDQYRIELISVRILAQRNEFELNLQALYTPSPALHCRGATGTLFSADVAHSGPMR